jgi:hypothetical protein
MLFYVHMLLSMLITKKYITEAKHSHCIYELTTNKRCMNSTVTKIKINQQQFIRICLIRNKRQLYITYTKILN